MRYHEDIAHDIDYSDESVDIHDLLLFSLGDEGIVRQRRDEVKEENPRNNPHRINRSIAIHTRVDEVIGRDESYDFWSKEREKYRYPSPESHEEFESFFRELFGVFDSVFLYGAREHGEYTIQKYRTIHHPYFDYLHGEGVESDDSICILARLHDREEDDVHLEKYHSQKERESVRKRDFEDMEDIVSIPGKPYTIPLACVPPGESRHEDIARESSEHRRHQSHLV